MNIHDKAAGLAGLGGSVDRQVVAATFYPTPAFDAKHFAALVVAERFRISPRLARLVCSLADLGGRVAP